MVMGSGWWDVRVRVRVGACGLEKECVAGWMEREAVICGVECVSIFFFLSWVWGGTGCKLNFVEDLFLWKAVTGSAMSDSMECGNCDSGYGKKRH